MGEMYQRIMIFNFRNIFVVKDTIDEAEVTLHVYITEKNVSENQIQR